MSISIRRTGGIDMIESLIYSLQAALNRVLGYATIANGTTAGKLKTTTDAAFGIGSRVFLKAATDDLWTLSGIATMSSGQYRAVTLYIDSAGTATIDSGTVSTTAALALSLAPVIPPTKSIFGVFVAGPSTNFGSALTSQGTLYHGIPDGYGTRSLVPLTPAGVGDYPVTVAP